MKFVVVVEKTSCQP